MLNDKEIQRLRALTNFPALVGYLRDELDWPIEGENIAEEMAFDYQPSELNIDARFATKIERIRQLRNLVDEQPWGIFYIEFESKRLPVMALRRILAALVKSNATRKAWHLSDLLFICVQGEPGKRGVAFAHFGTTNTGGTDELRTFSWDSREDHFYYLRNLNLEQLRWPRDDRNHTAWRAQWRAAFPMRHLETIHSAERMARKMAEHARLIRDLVEDLYEVEAAKGPLHGLFERFRIDLLHDLTPDAFADMIAQTITYGLFAAAEQTNDLSYSHIVEAIPNTNPFLKELLASLINEGHIDLAELGVDQLVELLREANVAQITHDFMRQTGSGQEDPVVHFYEQFLNEYDRRQRIERGVFYTPDPVVSYIVRSVDHLLKTEFGLEEGLASDAVNPATGEHIVQILDPATGTGTFLAHIIDLIAKHKNAGNTPAWNKYVSQHLLPRLNGFELMMAPYTIAHMKLGLKLKQTGYNFASNERLHVYLTNALEKPTEAKEALALAGFLSKESNEASKVKRAKPIMVVIGNPPYSYESSNTGEWITELVRDYYNVNGEPLGESNPRGLQDDYVKFIRFGQWRVEKTGQGILAFITNHSYLDNPTFRGMRQKLLETFTDIYIINLHGNSKRRETTLDGSVDENVFDIQQGVAVSIFLKRPQRTHATQIKYFDVWGIRDEKYKLLNNESKNFEWLEIEPKAPSYYFIPQNTTLEGEYNQGQKIVEIFPLNSVGLYSARDSLAVQWSYDEMANVAKDFATLHPEIAREKYILGEDSRDWQVKLAQADLRRTKIDSQKIQPITYRPYDIRYTYYTGVSRGFMCMPRSEVMNHMSHHENFGLCCMRRSRDQSTSNFYVAKYLVDKTILSSLDNANFCPLYIYPENSIGQLFDIGPWPLSKKGRRPNLDPKFVTKIERKLNLQFITDGRGDLTHTFGPEDVFHYTYAIFYSLAYRQRYTEFLNRDFPRLPLTDDLILFMKLVQKGADLVALHLLDEEYPAASWNLDNELSPLVEPGVSFVQGLDDCTIGKFGYNNYENERVYLDSARKESSSYFQGVPEEVWKFHIGGHQVCHKWLYDRRAINNTPGRTLSDEDILHYMYIVAALRETMVLMSEIDNIIENHGGWPLRGSQPESEPTVQKEATVMPIDEPLEKEQAQEVTPQLIDEKLAEESGLEYEAEDPTLGEQSSVQPFDPTLIRVETRPITVDGIIKRIDNKEINLQPDFQRMGGIWKDEAQSRLIESLLIRIPLPAFYMDASDDDCWLVIDGLQRLTALKRFILDKTLKLQKLEFWGQEYNGKTFADLPRPLQRRIEETQLTLYLVQKGTPHKVKFNIFKRINTGGVSLSGQEIRHALNLGPSTDLLIELAKTPEFQRATNGSISQMRMADRECILRFLAFKLKDANEYSSRDDLDSFLNDRMKEINDTGRQRPAYLAELRTSFKRAMETAHNLFGNNAFRKIDKTTGRRSPISKALFEVWAVNLDKLTDTQIKTLLGRKTRLEEKFLNLLDDPEFVIAISYSTGDPRRVKYRFSQVERVIRETLHA